MGAGVWRTSDYERRFKERNVKLTASGNIDSSYKVQDLYKAKCLDPMLNPYNVVRECCDTEEHPNTIPVILALDVTGSMGKSAEVAAQRLNEIMTKLYEEVTDVEFLVMGIGDMVFDRAPVQVSQFESDMRIVDQLEKVYFEFGGGGNAFESYTAAWYFGARHTKLDCLNRGKKGIIITLGDEPLNPYLPKDKVKAVFGDPVQADIETKDIYKEAIEKYDIFHISIDTFTGKHYEKTIKNTYGKYLDSEHLRFSSCDELPNVIVDIITKTAKENTIPKKEKINFFENMFSKNKKAKNKENKNEGIKWNF